MRDGVLLGWRPLPQRPTARGLGRRLEDRVVAEAAGAARNGGDPATDRAPRAQEGETAPRSSGVGTGECQHADVAGAAPVGRETRELAEQLGVVLRVGRMLSGIAPRP